MQHDLIIIEKNFQIADMEQTAFWHCPLCGETDEIIELVIKFDAAAGVMQQIVGTILQGLYGGRLVVLPRQH